MKPKLRWALIAGLVGLVVNVPISYALGICGPVVALTVGAVAAYGSVRQTKPADPRAGAEEGGSAGAIAGLIVAVGQVIGGLLVLRQVLSGDMPLLFGTLPDLSDPTSRYALWAGGFGVGVCFGFVGVVLSALAGAVVGYLSVRQGARTETAEPSPSREVRPAATTSPPSAQVEAEPLAESEGAQVRAIGVYRARLTKEAREALLQERYGERELSPEERQAAAEALEAETAYVVAIELLVENADTRFHLADFSQAGTDQRPHDPVYMTPGGSTVLPWTREPSSGSFRLVFYVDDFRPGTPLETSYGTLKLPPLSPMPERIVRLAPYRPPQ